MAYALVVNDDRSMLSFLATLVEKAGVESVLFDSPEDALRTVAPDNPPAIVITDIHMPQIDGWQFCRLLRSPEYRHLNAVPVVVVSATYRGDEPDRIAADLGAEAFVEVPFRPSELVELVRRIVARERPSALPRLLVVDDSRVLATALAAALAAAGYQVDTAYDMAQARAAIVAATPTFDVVVLDYHLPDGTGDQLLTVAREQRSECVGIMITADPSPGMAVEWMKSGAAAYVRKPFDPAYLIEVIARTRRERSLLNVEQVLQQRNHELRRTEDQFKMIAENTSDGIVVLTADAVAYVSPAYRRLQGYSLTASIMPADIDEIRRLIQEPIARNRATTDVTYTHRAMTADGRLIWREDHARLLYDDHGIFHSAIVICRDVSERKLVEDQLRAGLSEKEALLREIHHRVRNNLTVISSLLSLQAAQVTDQDDALVAFRTSQDRVLSMALVHQEMYESNDFSCIDMESYVVRLTRQITITYGVNYTFHVATEGDRIMLNIDHAIPCGLILNELITNAAKHAYPAFDATLPGTASVGEIRVQFHNLPGAVCEMRVTDCGIGLPADYRDRKALGLTLVRLLAEQLNGELSVEVDNGTTVGVRFPFHRDERCRQNIS